MTDEVDPRLLADPLLHRIPGEWPRAFLRLPWPEQRWRGRVFLIAYVLGGSVPFAWSMALNPNPEVVASNRAAVAEVADATIVEGLDHLKSTRSGRCLGHSSTLTTRRSPQSTDTLGARAADPLARAGLLAG